MFLIKIGPNLVTYFILAKNNQNSTNRKGHTSDNDSFYSPKQQKQRLVNCLFCLQM